MFLLMRIRGLVLGIFVFLVVAMTQWSLMSFANTEADEYFEEALVKIRAIKNAFSGLGLVRLFTI